MNRFFATQVLRDELLETYINLPVRMLRELTRTRFSTAHDSLNLYLD